MVEQASDDVPYIREILDIGKVPHIEEGKDLENLIILSTQTLKRNNKKC